MKVFVMPPVLNDSFDIEIVGNFMGWLSGGFMGTSATPIKTLDVRDVTSLRFLWEMFNTEVSTLTIS